MAEGRCEMWRRDSGAGLGRRIRALNENRGRENRGRTPIASTWQQAIHSGAIHGHVFALRHCQNENGQHTVFDLVNEPVALLAQLDLVAVAQITMKLSPWHPGMLQTLPQ